MTRRNVFQEPPTPLETAVRRTILALSDHREHGARQCTAERKVHEGQHPCAWIDRIVQARSTTQTPVEMLLAIPEALAFEIRVACGDLPATVDLATVSQDETDAECQTNPLQHKAATNPGAMTDAEWNLLELRVIREKARTDDYLRAIKQYRQQQQALRDAALARCQQTA